MFTYREAVRFLNELPRLVFGDSEQIQAVRTIEIVEELHERQCCQTEDQACRNCKEGYVECDECDGRGRCSHGNECHECDGSGQINCSVCEGEGFITKATVPEELTYNAALHLLQSANVCESQPTNQT